MTIEQALREAIRYEVGIRDLYKDAARGAPEEAAKRFYELLGKDEQSHVEYLERKLSQWKESGTISFEGLATSVPDAGRIFQELEKAAAPLAPPNLGGRTEALSRALKAEEETSAFYRGQAASFGGADRGGAASALFARFLEIEEGHTKIVRAELDLATRTGHWFDVREFDLED